MCCEQNKTKQNKQKNMKERNLKKTTKSHYLIFSVFFLTF